MKKKILHIIPSLERGGAQRLVITVCNELSKLADYDIKIIIFKNINDFKDDSKSLNIEHIKLSYKTHFYNKLISSELENLDLAIKKFAPDVLHSHLFEADLLCRVNTVKNIKYISHFHSEAYNLNKYLVNPLKKSNLILIHDGLFLEKLFKKSNNTFITISDEYVNLYSRKVNRMRLEIKKIYNCIDYDKFSVKKIRNLEGKEFKLINCARNIEIKNQEFLINVMHEFVNLEKNFSFTLTILGDGPLHQKLKNKTKKLSLEKHIFFPGMVKDVEKYYKESDLYLHSAVDGIFGISTLEACASGLPIVGLKGNSFNDVIKHKKNALIVQNNDINKFKSAILEITKNRKLYEKISKNNVIAGKNFSASSYVTKLTKIYNELTY